AHLDRRLPGRDRHGRGSARGREEPARRLAPGGRAGGRRGPGRRDDLGGQHRRLRAHLCPILPATQGHSPRGARQRLPAAHRVYRPGPAGAHARRRGHHPLRVGGARAVRAHGQRLRAAHLQGAEPARRTPQHGRRGDEGRRDPRGGLPPPEKDAGAQLRRQRRGKRPGARASRCGRVRRPARQRGAEARRGHRRCVHRRGERRGETPAQLAHRPRPPRARHRAPAPAHRLHAIRRSADPRLREPLHQVPRPLERPRRGQRGQGGCQGGARPGAGRDRRGGCRTPMSPLRIHRAQRPALAPVICRWDLDKTYLRSEFDSLRQLLRTAFERAEDKVEVPGVAALIKAIKRAAERHGREALVYVISASPPQIGKAIREKLALDGIPYDGIVFKDQLAQLKRGKLRNLREHVGFKLVELLRGRLDAPADARELLFGDDWESDSLIYSLYADVLAGRLAVDRLVPILRRIGVDARLVDQVVALAARVAGPDAVDRIFINLERRTPTATFRLFGPRVVPTFNYFQTAVVLGADGNLDVADVAAVGHTLIERSGYTARGLEHSLGDLVRRAAVSPAAAAWLGAALRAAGVLPARARGRRMLDSVRRCRRRKARRPPTPSPTGGTPDYETILDRLRPPGREPPLEGRPA